MIEHAHQEKVVEGRAEFISVVLTDASRSQQGVRDLFRCPFIGAEKGGG
jgi:hypothetical protein